MAETDILNPQTGYWAALGDNPNPSYGFTRKTNVNSQLARARMGSWYQRDTSNDGYAFALSFMNRPWATMLRLKQFYEIGKSGYFTVVDYDGGGRHHVGRFTTQPNPTQVANGKYNIQNLIFEEIPQARMLTYPGDFANWSRIIYVVDDFLNCQVAYQGNWSVEVNPALTVYSVAPTPTYPVMPVLGGELLNDPYVATPGSPIVPANYELISNAVGVNDFAQVQYTGFGFALTFRLNYGFGTWDIQVDGQTIVSALNLQLGTYTTLYGYTPVNSPVALLIPTVVPNIVSGGLSTVTVTLQQMPLDIHRVKMVRNNTPVYIDPSILASLPPYSVAPTNSSLAAGFQTLGNLPMAFPAITVIV